MASLPFVLSRAQLASSLAEVGAFTDGLVGGKIAFGWPRPIDR
jgi:hypothetical protein